MRAMLFGAAALLFAASVSAAVPLLRVIDDAKVIDRVAEASKRDLPQDLLKRIVNDDLELLRGRHTDGSYDYASYERLEADRQSQSFSIQPRKDDELERLNTKGSFVYRLIIESPSRRLVVTKNRRVYVDHVELEYIPVNSSGMRTQTFKIESWLEPGQVRPIDFAEVARQATVRVFVRGDKEAGYGNIVLTMVQARIVDNIDSPYADAVASEKAVIRAIDNSDIPSMRAMAARIVDSLAAKAATPASQTVEVVAPQAPAAVQAAPTPNVYNELQAIEDLLTGNDAERRQGLDRLHQLLRRLRP